MKIEGGQISKDLLLASTNSQPTEPTSLGEIAGFTARRVVPSSPELLVTAGSPQWSFDGSIDENMKKFTIVDLAKVIAQVSALKIDETSDGFRITGRLTRFSNAEKLLGGKEQLTLKPRIFYNDKRIDLICFDLVSD